MKQITSLFILLLMVIPFEIVGVTPVHIGKVSIDTSIYDLNDSWMHSYFIPGPFPNSLSGSVSMPVQVFRKKNTNQYDIYSFNGKIATTIIPESNIKEISYTFYFSCKMVDDDDGWETLLNCDDLVRNKQYFKVLDDDGTEMLSDSGFAYYGFDGNSTYVTTCQQGLKIYNYDSWRFRTNIMSPSNQPLAKTKSSQALPMQIYGLTGGDYRVTLSPSNGNQMNFQMFDLIGRCVFSKKIDNPTSPVTFTVPAGNVPNSPFIAKVNDGNGSFYKKQIPVK